VASASGRFFTFDVLDSHGGEIRAIAFNGEADRFEPVVAVGDIVEISKASLKPKRNTVRAVCPLSSHSCGSTAWHPRLVLLEQTNADQLPFHDPYCYSQRPRCRCPVLFAQQFNHTRHEFEIFLENQTILNVIPEDDMTKEIPRVQYRVRL